MYTMLIVEDERWEREGLVELWDWSELGIEIAGTAVDGIDGYEKAMELRPDIIVTDIRMPGMTGLEMARRVRAGLPDVRIVMLTGYSDFEYAQEAIRFNADDYVLKPLEEDELRKTMLRVVARCEQLRAQRYEESQVRERLHSGDRMAVQKLLTDLLLGRRADLETAASELLALESWLAGGQAVGQDDGAAVGPDDRLGAPVSGYAVMVVAPQPQESVPDELVRRSLGRPCYIVGCDEFDGALAVVVPLEEDGGPDAGTAEALRCAERLLTEWDSAATQLPTIGLAADPAMSLTQLSEAYQQAVEAARHGVFYEISGVVTSEAEVGARRHFGGGANVFLSQWQELSRELRLHVLSLQEMASRDVLDQMFALIRKHPGAGKEYVAALLNAMLIDLSLLEDDQPQSERPGSVELLALNRIQEMQDYVEAAVTSLMERLESKRNHKDDYIVEKAARLIEEKYGSNELSLTMLAEEVFISPNHLGVLFKKAKGMTVHQYISEVRMQKAEELLRKTKIKVSEVAERIGIANHSYFSTLFKQKHGMSPGEYQELMQRR